MNTIQTLYEAGHITSDEMGQLAGIREDFIEAMEKGAGAVVEFVQETFGGCSESQLEKVSEMVEALRTETFSSSDSPEDYIFANLVDDLAFEKRAGPKIGALGATSKYIMGKMPPALTSATKKALTAGIIGTVGLHLLNTISQGVKTIGHPIQELMDRSRTARQSEMALTSILKDNPALKADRKTFENFAILQKYAPQTVATNKPLAETMLKKMQQWGGVDPQSLSQMIQMEARHMENIKTKHIVPETEQPSLKVGPDLLGALM